MLQTGSDDSIGYLFVCFPIFFGETAENDPFREGVVG